MYISVNQVLRCSSLVYNLCTLFYNQSWVHMCDVGCSANPTEWLFKTLDKWSFNNITNWKACTSLYESNFICQICFQHCCFIDFFSFEISTYIGFFFILNYTKIALSWLQYPMLTHVYTNTHVSQIKCELCQIHTCTRNTGVSAHSRYILLGL